MKRSTQRRLRVITLSVVLVLAGLTANLAGVAVVYVVNDKPFTIECANGDTTMMYCVDGKAWPW
jgi:hypothetical protein